MQTLHHRYLSIVLYRCCVSYSVGNKNTSKPKVSNNRNFQNGSFLVTYFERICATNFSGDCPNRAFALCVEFRAPHHPSTIINYHTLQSLSTVGCLSKRECQSKSRPQNLKTKFDKNHAASPHCFPSVNAVLTKCDKNILT